MVPRHVLKQVPGRRRHDLRGGEHSVPAVVAQVPGTYERNGQGLFDDRCGQVLRGHSAGRILAGQAGGRGDNGGTTTGAGQVRITGRWSPN